MKTSLINLFSVVTATTLGFHSLPAMAAETQSPASLNNALANQLQYILEAKERYIVKFRSTPVLGDALMSDERHGGSQGTISGGRFDQQAAMIAVNRVAGRIHKVFDKRSVVVASMDSEAVRQLRMRDDVESISPDPIRMPMSQTVPYSYGMINALSLAQPDTSARKVCVIDTGISAGHEDLPDQNNGLTGSATGTAVGDWFNDGYGHGTHVAGTIAAYDNNLGSVGVYPGVNLHVVKVFNDAGSWTYASNLVEAIDQCADAGAHVVNMSLGGPGDSNYENQALTEFADQGILMVAAAGNDGNGSKAYPASYDSVMSVAALSSSGTRASYSQYNDAIEIAAPGSGIYSTHSKYGYRYMSGTSMATPHVSGAAALVWSFFEECTAEQVRETFTRTAVDKGASGRDEYYGYGLLNVQGAYDEIAVNGCDGSDPVDSGSDDPEIVEVVQPNISMSGGKWLRQWITIPQGASHLEVRFTGGIADLSVNQGRTATRWHWDCYSNNNNGEEACTIESPAAGMWSIGILTKSQIVDGTLRYSYIIESESDDDQVDEEESEDWSIVEADATVPIGQWKRNWWIDVPEGATTLTVKLEGGMGNGDLFVNKGRTVTFWHWKCRSTDVGNEEICTVNSPGKGRWNIGIYAKQGVSEASLSYSLE